MAKCEGFDYNSVVKKSIYISRPVVNTQEIEMWMRQQGFTSCLHGSSMHVTVAFDHRLHDWDALPLDTNPYIEVREPDERSISIFKGAATVLEFYSQELIARWGELVQSGLVWRWPDYRPHITLTYNTPLGFRPSRVMPFPGVIVLGPEEPVEVTSKWANSLEEHPL
jgi:hypothetical protein